MFGRFSLLLLLVFLLPTALFAQSDMQKEHEEKVIVVQLENGEIAAYELLLSEILETVRRPDSQEEREVAGSIDIPAAGEYLLVLTQVHSDLIETEELGPRNWYFFETSRPSGECRNLSFDDSLESIIFLNCPGSLTFEHRSSAQFITLHLIQISNQPPFAGQPSSPRTNSNDDQQDSGPEIPEITLSISKGQLASISMQFSALIENANQSSVQSYSNHIFSAQVKFQAQGEYLFFVRVIGNDILNEANEDGWLWFGNLNSNLIEVACQNRVIKDSPHTMETLSFFLNCPSKARLSASGDAKYVLAVLLKVSE